MESEQKKRALWKKSAENFDVSRIAKENGKFNAAASRFYYGMVFATRALLLSNHSKKNIDIDDNNWPKHDIFIRMVGEHLGHFNEALENLLFDALELRVSGDYHYRLLNEDNFIMLEKETEDFLAVIEDELKRNR